ncbi:MAG TPA: PepSY-associated TM helix domain-containing protein, partial [Arenimonas sp.]|nr:PepSY-associated TM helix domain-containing protein [Arenimonas sp.]
NVESVVFDIDAAWQQFERVSAGWSSVSLHWPGADGVLQFRYLDADPAHERASNTLLLDTRTVAVVEHDRYDDRTLPQRIVGSMFAIHRGSYFGSVGPLVWMLASLMMPLFAVTGWMLYLDRRRRASKGIAKHDAGVSTSSPSRSLPAWRRQPPQVES